MYKKFDDRAKAILKNMSVREKIGQLTQVSMPENEEQLKRAKEQIRKGEVGSFILANSATAGNDRQHEVKLSIINELQKCAIEEGPSNVPIIFGRDVIHGHHTVYPIPLASACSFNPELVEKCYRCVAEEAFSDGIRWTFSPMADICHDPRWGRIIEGPGEDPFLASVMTSAVIKGFQGEQLSAEGSIAACVKHFLGYGASEGGRDYFRTEISDYTLYNLILPPFRAAVNAGVATVMSSFNDINGQPTTSSRRYLTDILRTELGFEGFVVSDWEAVRQLMRQGVASTDSECAEMALTAGVDMDMIDKLYLNNLESLINEGKINEEIIDTAVLRILRIKLALGLFENPYCRKITGADNHLELANQLAAESAVLLKNNGDLLPLDKNAVIGLAGPFLNERRSLLGGWVLDGKPENTPSFLEAFREICSDNTYVSDSEELFDNSSFVFNQSDYIVLALGESHMTTGEAHSVENISLPAEQVALAKKAKESGKKTIGVIFCGRPVALQNIEPYLDAILCVWHAGSETAHVAARLIFGDLVPCGKTSVTFVKSSGHIPLYYNTTPSGRSVDGYYGKGAFVNYCDNPGAPMYPFGFGLSYTKFIYSEIISAVSSLSLEDLKKGEKFKFSVKIKNVGKYDAKETAELYIQDPSASYMRPIRELKGFKKIFLKSGEERSVEFELGFSELGYYCPNGNYTVEPGEIRIFIGESCLTANQTQIKILK